MAPTHSLLFVSILAFKNDGVGADVGVLAVAAVTGARPDVVPPAVPARMPTTKKATTGGRKRPLHPGTIIEGDRKSVV